MPATNDFVHVLLCQRRLSDIGGNNVILSDLRFQLTNKKVYKNCHINLAHHFTGVETVSYGTYFLLCLLQGTKHKQENNFIPHF